MTLSAALMKVKKIGFLLQELHLFHQTNCKEVAISLFSELNEESLGAFGAAREKQHHLWVQTKRDLSPLSCSLLGLLCSEATVMVWEVLTKKTNKTPKQLPLKTNLSENSLGK